MRDPGLVQNLHSGKKPTPLASLPDRDRTFLSAAGKTGFSPGMFCLRHQHELMNGIHMGNELDSRRFPGGWHAGCIG
jgi:hypothetical protein